MPRFTDEVGRRVCKGQLIARQRNISLIWSALFSWIRVSQANKSSLRSNLDYATVSTKDSAPNEKPKIASRSVILHSLQSVALPIISPFGILSQTSRKSNTHTWCWEKHDSVRQDTNTACKQSSPDVVIFFHFPRCPTDILVSLQVGLSHSLWALAFEKTKSRPKTQALACWREVKA